MNKELFADECDYMGEAAYRKPYQQAKRFYEAGVFSQFNEDAYIAEMREAKQELRKAKQQMFDERTEYNKKLREAARTENDLKYLGKLIEERGFTHLQNYDAPVIHSDNDLVICISDFHLGLSTDTTFGKFNKDIAAKRLSKYLDEILAIQKRHNSENATVLFLGDMINGNIHFTTQLENRENLAEQIQIVAELLADFLNELGKNFPIVYVNGVAGNHSRTSFKDQVLRGERLDNLIPWYLKAVLKDKHRIQFVDDNNYDATIGKVVIRGNEYLLVHGDFDTFNEAGVSKLVMMVGKKPTGIFYGHLHKCSYDVVAGVSIVRSGCFSGTGDDYCISKRILGGASQMVTVVDDRGIQACYPISLE
ncbi:MAG: hypothetical protein LUC91_00760 [Prevotella sp.]|nr:hypothetical protein [Prevotella sp.]